VKTTSKTARSTKKASAKTAKTPAKRAPADKKTASRKADPMAKVGRESAALIEALEGMGLLPTDAAEALAAKASALGAGTLSEGLGNVAAFEKALGNRLSDFAGAGGDGKAGSIHQALIVWRKQVSELPVDEKGLTEALVSLGKVLPFCGATIFLREPEPGRVLPLVSAGFTVDLISRIRFTEGQGFSAWVAARKKPVLYPALHRNEAPREDQVRSFMAAPLVVGGECIGVVTLGHNVEGTYTPATLRTLLLASAMLAGHVQRHLAERQILAREITDRVTGFYTAAYLRSRLEEEVVRCRELGYSMSVLVFRMVELSELHARFGGDYRRRCMADLGDLIRGWKAPTELVGHLEDGRLVALLAGAGPDRAEARGAALGRILEKHSFPRRKRMSVRVGVAAYPSDAESAQELLSVADKGLSESARSTDGTAVSASAPAAS
jgi:GGDEF domain-containing protein